MKKQSFNVTGMTCSACSSHVEKNVSKLKGIEKVEVNLLANSMNVNYNEKELTESDIISAVEKSGYGASPIGKDNTSSNSKENNISHINNEATAIKKQLIISFAFLLPLMYISMGHMLHLPLPSFMSGVENAGVFALSQLLLCIPIVIANKKYFTGGFKSLFLRAPNMNSLIAIGSSAAIFYGIFATYRIVWALGNGHAQIAENYMHDLYFESAAMILCLISLGKTLEAKSKGKTGAAIQSLLDLSPKTAIKIVDGVEKEVPIEEIRENDILAVKPGSSVPVDGTILSGSSSIDESAITGESIPVEKQQDDDVTGGTINTSGYFTMVAKRVGDDSTLSQIISLVEQAGASKAPIAKLADKISGVFVPIVMLISIITFAIWLINGNGLEFAMARAISVLIISCPCALGLATPVAIMVGTGKGAKNGILYKNADAIENLCHINSMVLDKTGTITQGKPHLTDIIPYNMDKNALLSFAYAMESKSEHPLATAIVNEAQQRGIKAVAIKDFKALSGLGIQANIENEICYAGNLKFMNDNGIDVSSANKTVNALAEQGKTPVFFAKASKLAGIIALADLPKPDSKEALQMARHMGLDTIMLTGDNEKTANAIAQSVGIAHVVPEVMPQDKDAQVQKLQEQGKKVAMVGDGINDAPALTRANVGIAIGAGTDVAIESADIVLMRSSLKDAITAVDLSKKVLRNIKLNLFWAFIYNIIGIPIAAGLFYPAFGIILNPMIGAAAMSLSSIFVVTNALRLNLYKSPFSKQANNMPSTSYDSSDNIKNNIIIESESIKMTKTIFIDGMTCPNCQKHVEKALNSLNGVFAAVDLEKKSAVVTLEEKISDDELKKAVEDAGYTVTDIKDN